MGRPRRVATGGIVYQVLNRATARSQIFHSPADYQAYEQLLIDAWNRFDMRILAFCIMPNHWHMALWPRKDDDLSKYTGLADTDPFATLACLPPHSRRGSSIPGTV